MMLGVNLSMLRDKVSGGGEKYPSEIQLALVNVRCFRQTEKMFLHFFETFL